MTGVSYEVKRTQRWKRQPLRIEAKIGEMLPQAQGTPGATRSRKGKEGLSPGTFRGNGLQNVSVVHSHCLWSIVAALGSYYSKELSLSAPQLPFL